MNRLVVLSAFAIGFIALVAVQWTVDPVARADTVRSREMIVVVADGAAVSQTELGADYADSFIALVAALQNDHLFTFITTDDPTNVLGPVGAADPEFKSFQNEFQTRLLSEDQQQGWSLADALAEGQIVLGEERAAPGSKMYVLTGGSPRTDFQQLSPRLLSLVNRFGDKGWLIEGVGLPGASPQSIEFLKSLSASSGGRVFELSISDGYQQLAEAILSQGAMGSLAQVGSREMKYNELLSSIISVAPGTREATLLIFKESPYGSLRLSNPSGFEVSAGDRTESSVVETAHVVVWRLVDPVPGNWKMDVRGVEGVVSAWEYSSNKYSLVLRSASPLPLDEPNILVGFVTEGGRTVALNGVRLFANITSPQGGTASYEMKDDGLEGDTVAGDGYFSATLPPLHAQGDYVAELEMVWLAYNHRISSESSFKAQAFPALEVKTLNVDEVRPGERTKVATVFVHVQGGPYPVPAQQLTTSLASPGEQEGMLELEPRRLFGDGPAWEYDVFFTASAPGHHTVAFFLSLEYAGSVYSHVSDSVVISAVAPSSLAVPQVEPSTVEPATTLAPIPAAAPFLRPQIRLGSDRSSFPWWVLAFPAVLLVGAVGAAVYLLTRTRPYGYIYNDRDEPLVDFTQLRQHPVWGVVFRGLVRGSQLSLPGLEKVSFHFKGDLVRLRSRGEHQTIRVNNQPLVGEATIHDRTWIGTSGKLYTFLLSPSAGLEGGIAD